MKVQKSLSELVLQRVYTDEGKPVEVTVKDIIDWQSGRANFNAAAVGTRLFSHCKEIANLVFSGNHKARTRVVSHRFPHLRVLLDEGVTKKAALVSEDLLGPCQHVESVGLKGRKDPDVVAWAMKQGVSIIFTKDMAVNDETRDLTGIVRRAFFSGQYTPLVVHVCEDNTSRSKAPEIIRECYHQIGTLAMNHSTPFIRIHPFGVVTDGEVFMRQLVATAQRRQSRREELLRRGLGNQPAFR